MFPQLVLLIKKSLSDTSMFASSSSVFQRSSILLRYWGKLRNTPDELYATLTDSLWTSLRNAVYDSVSIEKKENDADESNPNIKDELEKKLRIHQKIINALKNPADVRQKKQTRVSIPTYSPLPIRGFSSHNVFR